MAIYGVIRLQWVYFSIRTAMDWIGLDLFNDDTHHSAHIICPVHENVSQSCFHSLNRLLKPDHMMQVWGLLEVNKLHQIGSDSYEEMYRMSDRSYQIKEFHFS